MKKFTLFLLTLMVSVLSSFASEQPIPAFSPLATDGQTVQYLYNVETHAFVCGANDWGTRASVDATKGYPIKVQLTEDGTYRLNDLLPNGNWNAIDCNGVDSWVDGNGRTGVDSWRIELVGENTYEITNDQAEEGLVWGVDPTLANTRCVFKNDGLATTWAFVSEADYNAYWVALKAWKKETFGSLELKNEISSEVADLNGKTVVIADAATSSNVLACIGDAHDMAVKAVEGLENGGSEYFYTKVAAVEVEGSTVYTLQMVNAEGKNFEKWGEKGYANFQPVGTGAVMFALGLKGDEYGQDAAKHGIWTISKEEGGYTIQNVGRQTYWNPNKADATTAEPVVVKLYEKAEFVGPKAEAPAITFDVAEDAELDLDSVKSIHISIATPEGVEEADDLFIEGVLYGIDGTNQPIFSFSDFEDGVDVPISRLTPGNAYSINITKIAYGKEVGFDEETYMPIYENEIKAAEGEALASLNFALKAPSAPEVGEITAAYNPAGPVIVITFEDQKDVVPSWNVDILLNGEKVSCEYGQEWNEIYAYPGAALADGEYTLVFPVGSLTFDSSVDNDTECSVTFTVGNPTPELAVSLVAEDETEYALNTHSTVTVDMPLKGIVVTGLDQVMDEVTYAILGKNKTTVASGTLSVNTIGYAEFLTLVNLYEGNDYQIVVATEDSTLFDCAVIGAAEPAEIEISATLDGEVSINSHSEVSVEQASNIEVTFDGVVPTQAGYSVLSMKNEETEEGLLWEVDEVLEQGALSLNGKGYAEFEQTQYFEAGTKYLIIVSYATANSLRNEVKYVINGAYGSASELAVTLVANDSVEYLLNTHSNVTVDQPISAIKVAGLDNEMEEVSYAIYGMDKATLASGILSVNTIGYAEFAPVTLYEGNQYNVVVTVGENTVFDQIVIGAAEEPIYEIAATINDSIALNTHSAISAEAIKSIEVSFDGFAPTQAGYSINTLVQVADSAAEASSWEIGETLAQGELSLNGKGYAELEEAIVLNAGTKYCVIINADNQSATFEINGAYEEEIDENLIEIAQTIDADQNLACQKTEEEGNTKYVSGADISLMYKMLNVDVNGCDYIVVKFSAPAPEGVKLAFWNGQEMVDVTPGATEYKYVFADDAACAIKDGIIPQVAMLTLWNPGKEINVAGVYKHAIDITGINAIATASKANGKYIENGKVVIVKNGVKYNVAGSIIK